ncbi:MAG: ATP-dependent DNA helicase [Armatimonadota bacterium]|nr:ATP-dependent DNA helicase [Armatimonadota bacterium]
MATKAEALVDRALGRLAERPGFVERENQRQLALLISDCIAGNHNGVFEAPTGLGKSLAALIPALAHAIANEKRIVISTYTNVLAEQYLYKDLPLALSLFDEDDRPATAFLIGRQRYACVAEIEAHSPDMKRDYLPKAKVGIESEFRTITRLKGKEALSKWRQIAVPQICPARMCEFYGPCVYYRARREASKAGVVITNHSVVLMDSLQGENPLLGNYDFLVVDEAHDLPQAAYSAFEFTLDERMLSQVAAIASGMERQLRQRAVAKRTESEFNETFGAFRKTVDEAKLELSSLAPFAPRSGILETAPEDIATFPTVASRYAESMRERIFPLTDVLLESCKRLDALVRKTIRKDEGEEDTSTLQESILSYRQFLAEFAFNCKSLAKPEDKAVSYVESGFAGVSAKKAVTEVANLLKEKVWNMRPAVCLSATLAIDGEFDFFRGLTGIDARFSEILPSPFDFAHQAAIYLPTDEAIPDPVAVRKEGAEDLYYAAIASEIETIIKALRGRTLALFHSRAEMEGVLEKMDMPEDLPIYVQRKSGAGMVGESFRKNVRASLFALRSFWTGFDAPGETLTCVALTRIPFELPVDPPSLVRQASMILEGRDPFRDHSLAMAKMLMRQGAGRLIRNAEDKGIIAILDPRVRTKFYGEAILENLPKGMRTFRDIHDAMAAIGIDDPE